MIQTRGGSTATAAPCSEPGIYIYQTSFNVTGVDRNNAVIAMSFGTDDAGPEVLLNGVLIPNDPSIGFGSKSWLGINSASAKAAGTEIKQGHNTLTFVVENGGADLNPTGFRVDDVFGAGSPDRNGPDPGLVQHGRGRRTICRWAIRKWNHITSLRLIRRANPLTRSSCPPAGPINPWAINTSSSRWIVPTEDPDGTAAAG